MSARSSEATEFREDQRQNSENKLSETHPVGKSKAAFFALLGFSRERPEELLAALLRIARSEPVVDRILTPFGTKYVIEGRIEGQARAAVVRTVWFLERNAAVPRLVTAYPASREDA